MFIFCISCESRTYDEISEEVSMEERISYVNHIQPIIEQSCIGCHSNGGPAASRPLTNYREVSSRIDRIIDLINRPVGDPQRMPPRSSLSPSQIELFSRWRLNNLAEN
ncbi:hypothetical protein BBD32_12350 [Elizabethkingia anophelis]|uniref:Cytochrome C Planctomycete-type domain-containing protein n=2 Tax=Elizabethkingia anophelis TaxID=1117645 RepID=A0AAU8V1V5_9FLAO|nr:hypothetical protein BBD32_12350 [Elizabethkingia anophelis]OPB58905.1 hypothetical protein BAY11_17925 [Elizabethkingia anophelis]